MLRKILETNFLVFAFGPMSAVQLTVFGKVLLCFGSIGSKEIRVSLYGINYVGPTGNVHEFKALGWLTGTWSVFKSELYDEIVTTHKGFKYKIQIYYRLEGYERFPSSWGVPHRSYRITSDDPKVPGIWIDCPWKNKDIWDIDVPDIIEHAKKLSY